MVVCCRRTYEVGIISSPPPGGGIHEVRLVESESMMKALYSLSLFLIFNKTNDQI
jgi:hypothetical protein